MLWNLICTESIQKGITRILDGLEGVLGLMHNRLLGRSTLRLRRVLSRLQKAGVRLNDQCDFNGQEMVALGVRVEPKMVSTVGMTIIMGQYLCLTLL